MNSAVIGIQFEYICPVKGIVKYIWYLATWEKLSTQYGLRAHEFSPSRRYEWEYREVVVCPLLCSRLHCRSSWAIVLISRRLKDLQRKPKYASSQLSVKLQTGVAADKGALSFEVGWLSHSICHVSRHDSCLNATLCTVKSSENQICYR